MKSEIAGDTPSLHSYFFLVHSANKRVMIGYTRCISLMQVQKKNAVQDCELMQIACNFWHCILIYL